jgi:major membrane immunogen (membrane-anchored lipoprotein)
MHVYSTMGQSVRYVKWQKTLDQLPVIEKDVLIRGGTGVIDAKTLITPCGIRTEVPDEDYEWLKEDFTFKRHVQNGFITVTNVKEKASKVAKNMTAKDGSAQFTPQDFEDKNKGAAKMKQ